MMTMFSVNLKKNGKRIGILKTKSGAIDTPFFMPDATRGFVKSLSKNDLEMTGVGPMVVNTYHLYLNPGVDIIKKAICLKSRKPLVDARRGNIHNFMNWQKPLLSDSGGYQVFSLIHKNPKMGKITENEVIFKSPIDGSEHILTPEKAIQIQFDLGVDMMVCLDDPAPNFYPERKIKNAVERTIRWAERCMIEYKKQLKIRKIKKENRPLIFCVVQGGGYLNLRKKCVDELIKIGFSAKGGPALGWDGYGFGARHLDAEGNFMEEILRETASFIPENSLRFALGVGTPEDIVRCVNMGWDMFDCVIPTREGRHGRLFVWDRQSEFQISNLKFQNKSNPPINGQSPKFYTTINISNKKFKEDFSPVDENCECELCRNYTKSYLSHLFAVKDPLAQRLASIHNLSFYLQLMKLLQSEKK